jgi:hypothetical protein
MDKQPIATKIDEDDEDIDGCGCGVTAEEATGDEDLPVAEGGIA